MGRGVSSTGRIRSGCVCILRFRSLTGSRRLVAEPAQLLILLIVVRLILAGLGDPRLPDTVGAVRDVRRYGRSRGLDSRARRWRRGWTQARFGDAACGRSIARLETSSEGEDVLVAFAAFAACRRVADRCWVGGGFAEWGWIAARGPACGGVCGPVGEGLHTP